MKQFWSLDFWYWNLFGICDLGFYNDASHPIAYGV